jgi:metallophosphoesterase (TIGR00282 family)
MAHESSETLRLLFIGDIVASAGMNVVLSHLPNLVKEQSIDVVIANGENVNEGKGIIKKEADQLFAAGVHVITSGNHIWERWPTKHLLAEEPRVLRPHNYPRENAGSGVYILSMNNGVKIGVINIQGRVYMQSIDCPFKTMEKIIPNIVRETPIVLVDFHAEATAEKVAMGWYLDGKVSAVVGTHTHIPTADERVLPGGTAYITDVGMSGPYASVVGMKTDIALRRFFLQTPHKFEPADGDARLSAVLISINRKTGRATGIQRIQRPSF